MKHEIESLNVELINSTSIEELEKRLEMEEPVCGILWGDDGLCITVPYNGM